MGYIHIYIMYIIYILYIYKTGKYTTPLDEDVVYVAMARVLIMPLLAQWVLCFASHTRLCRYSSPNKPTHLVMGAT